MEAMKTVFDKLKRIIYTLAIRICARIFNSLPQHLAHAVLYILASFAFLHAFKY
jgi:hypothetical protein